MTPHAIAPGSAVPNRRVSRPRSNAAGGATYSSAIPATVPASRSGEWPSCVYAVRATIVQIGARPTYGRTLRERVESPRCNRPPSPLTAVASAQSSISSPAMRSTPPIRRSAASASSTEPPAAPAVPRRSSFTHANG